MGITAAKGSFGIGLQTSKGVAATAINYIPVSNVGLQPEQNAQSLPPEVGGSLWSKGSFKTGVAVFGDVGLTARADSIGWLLRAFAGTATSVANGEANVYDHTIMPATDVSSIPWCTLVKNVSDVWTEQYVDCRVDTLRLDMPAAGILTAALSWVGITPSEIANPTETFDDSNFFIACEGAVKFDQSETKKVTRISLDFSNNLSRDERVVGSYYLDDITMMARACRVTCDTFLDAATWYRQVYNNATTAWDPQIVSAELDVAVESAEPAKAGGTLTSKFRIVVPNIDYLAYPVAMAGGDLIRITMTADLTISGSNLPFYIELRNAQANYNLA